MTILNVIFALLQIIYKKLPMYNLYPYSQICVLYYHVLSGVNDSTHSKELGSYNNHLQLRILSQPDTEFLNTVEHQSKALYILLGATIISAVVICIVLVATVIRCRNRGRAYYHYDEPTVEFSKLVE